MVHPDRFGSDDSLLFCGYRHLKADHRKGLSAGRVHVTGLEGFCRRTRERLMKHHGVSKDRFPPHLKELGFRYNHRTGDLFDQAANYLCDLVTKRDSLPYFLSFIGSFTVFGAYFRC
jgi:hypothetical protein